MTMPWLKTKKNKPNRQTKVHMTQHRKLKNKQHEPHQKLTRDDPGYSGRVSRSCSPSCYLVITYACRRSIVTNRHISIPSSDYNNGCQLVTEVTKMKYLCKLYLY